MRYFIIAGEASGDLHASHLMRALRERDAAAEFYFYGGDRMIEVGGTCLCHYRSISYMGFVTVLRHLRTILRAMRDCKRSVLCVNPDVVILVDYPGFNLSIAKFVKMRTQIPVYYYILPKVWAWKEKRVRKIRAYLDERYSILPFETDFFEGKHQCPVHYIGNPSVDEVCRFQKTHPVNRSAFLAEHGLEDKPVIALLPGSRLQEIKDNFRRMVLAAFPYVERGYQLLVAGTADIPDAYYAGLLKGLSVCLDGGGVRVLRQQTYPLLQYAEAALVTSGTATLETALFRVPQVVCYYAPLGRIVRAVKPHFLKVKYISLVNLILDRELVTELIGDRVNPETMRKELSLVLSGGNRREKVLQGYEEMIRILGESGAAERAADMMLSSLGAR